MNEKTDIQSEELNDYTIKDLTIDEIVPNVIDDFIVTIFEDHHTIFLPSTTTGIQFKVWNRGRGGVFSKDVLKHTQKKKTGQYIIIKGNEVRCIARLITEEEQSLFGSLKLIDGKIKDIPYMILKNLKEDEKLISTRKYKEYIEKDIINEEVMIKPSSTKIMPDDDYDHHTGSISLFTE
jgi:hypothetical protein